MLALTLVLAVPVLSGVLVLALGLELGVLVLVPVWDLRVLTPALVPASPFLPSVRVLSPAEPDIIARPQCGSQ